MSEIKAGAQDNNMPFVQPLSAQELQPPSPQEFVNACQERDLKRPIQVCDAEELKYPTRVVDE